MQQGLLDAPDAVDAAAPTRRGVNLAAQLEAHPSLFASLIEAVALRHGHIRICLHADATAKALGVTADALSADVLAFDRPFALRRRGVETRIVAGETKTQPDPVLVRTLAEARVWAKELRAGTTLAEIAASTGRSEPYIRTRIPLAFLAPRLQADIVEGRHPADLSVARLLRDGIPMGWDDQARLFGHL